MSGHRSLALGALTGECLRGHRPALCLARACAWGLSSQACSALLSRSLWPGCSFFFEPLPRRSEVPGWGFARAWGRQRASPHRLTAGVALPRKAVSCGVSVAGPVSIRELLLEYSTEFHVISTETRLGAAGPVLQTRLGAGAATGSFPVGTRKGVEERSGRAPRSVLHIVLSPKIFGCSCWFRGTQC